MYIELLYILGNQKIHDSLHCDIHFIAMVWNPTALRYACITIGRGGDTLQHGALDGGVVDARKKEKLSISVKRPSC